MKSMIANVCYNADFLGLPHESPNLKLVTNTQVKNPSKKPINELSLLLEL